MDNAVPDSAGGNAELLRLHYLQAMGISSYYPRFCLPGALPSEACEWPQPVGTETPAPVVATQAPAPAEARSRPALQAPPARTEPVVPRRTEASPPARPAAGQEAALQFQLLLLPVDADLALLCQIPALSGPRLQDRQARLLQNLLRWLGRALPAENRMRRFQWPLPGMALHNDPGQAAAGLGHFVEQAALEQPFRHLLLLGGQLAEQLAGTAFAPAQCRLTVVPGLDEMLALPHLKREAWQALLPLHAALAARPA